KLGGATKGGSLAPERATGYNHPGTYLGEDQAMIGTISSSTAANGSLAIATKQSAPKTGCVSSPSSLSVENTTHLSVRGLAPSAVASTGESQTKTDRPDSGISGRDLSSKE